jgi:hypothetical protein
LDGNITIINDKNREQQSVFMTLEYFPEMGEVEWLCASLIDEVSIQKSRVKLFDLSY